MLEYEVIFRIQTQKKRLSIFKWKKTTQTVVVFYFIFVHGCLYLMLCSAAPPTNTERMEQQDIACHWVSGDSVPSLKGLSMIWALPFLPGSSSNT